MGPRLELSTEVRGPPRGAPSKGTVVLIHGWPDSAALFEPTQSYLAKRGWRTVAANLPGHGPGEAAFRGSTEDVVDGCLAVVEREAPCVLLGHDWGADYSFRVLRAAPPGLITRLVCLDIGAEIDTSATTLALIAAYQGFLALTHALAPRALGDALTRWFARLVRAPEAASAAATELYHYTNFLTGVLRAAVGRGRVPKRGGGGGRVPLMFCYGTPWFSSAAWRAKVAARPGNCVLGFKGGHWFFVKPYAQPAFHAALGEWIEGRTPAPLPSGASWSPQGEPAGRGEGGGAGTPKSSL